MPPLPNVNNVLRLRYIGTVHGSAFNNILHLMFQGGPPTVADCNGIATQAFNAYATNLMQLVDVNSILTRCEVQDLTSPTANEGSHDGSQAGSIATQSGPASLALVVSQIINFRYRGGHPRFYVPGPTMLEVLNGKVWTNTFLTSARAQATSFRSALNAIVQGTMTFQMATVSYRTAHALRPTPLPFVVQQLVVHGRVDTQRRRLGKETP